MTLLADLVATSQRVGATSGRLAKIRELAPEEGDFGTVWRQLMGLGQLKASRVYPHPWVSIDTIDALMRAEATTG